jgi:hypothetical protein
MHSRRPALMIAVLPWLALSAVAANAAPAASLTEAQTRADRQFTTYAFAHEFGSGVYDFNGRTLQVYGLPFAWTLREVDANRPGLRLRLPVTLGFLDFQPQDVLDSGLPEQVDSVSFVPGIEFDWRVGDHWRVLPYAQAGAALASESEVDTELYGTGVRGERSFTMLDYAGLYAAEGTYSAVHYPDGDLPDDDFLRIRNGVTLSKGSGHWLAGREVEYGLYTFVDAYLDPPTGPTTGLDVPAVQFEAGVVLGTRPTWRVMRVPVPRLGLSYRFAGDVSSIRFVIGAPF